jgi:hypothetical protein
MHPLHSASVSSTTFVKPRRLLGFLPFSAFVCYTSLALVVEILRKGGGALYAIPMDHFFTMRDLQECVAKHAKMSGP